MHCLDRSLTATSHQDQPKRLYNNLNFSYLKKYFPSSAPSAFKIDKSSDCMSPWMLSYKAMRCLKEILFGYNVSMVSLILKNVLPPLNNKIISFSRGCSEFESISSTSIIIAQETCENEFLNLS